VVFYNRVNGFTFTGSSIATLAVTGNKAVFTGSGTESINGGPSTGPFNYTVTVQDFGSSGDTFKIEISDPTGTVAGSTTAPIVRGDIEQHQ
jgi:hypothetical protein